jgi:hypothetical protein
MVDLIVMIVMIVFLLGMATLAFITYDKAQKERGYLAALREIPARQKSELDTVKARYSELSTLVGLKGNADFTSEAEIERMLREGSRMMAEYYTVHAPGSEESKSIAGVDQNADSKKLVPRVDATGRVEYVEEPYKTIKVGGTNIVAERIYNPTEITTLQGGIARQDDVIHKLVTTEIPNINKQRVNQGVEKSKAAGERSRGAEAAYAATNQKIRTSEEDVGKLNSDSRDYETALAQAKEAEANTAVRLTAADLRADREAAYRTATEAAEAQNAAVDAQDAYRLQSDKRRMDDSRDPDGAVFLVDDTSGYVWINIGQKSGVQLEQTFQVVRPSANLSSETQIAEIRVKELLRGNVARCRVDSLNDPNVYPAAGDLIKNPNFSARQYKKWALVGTFGGTFSKHTRQQLTDILRRTGFQVVDKMDLTVDAVIIGGNWRDDPEWQKAKEWQLNVETYPEEEVLHFLGLTGPDRR